MTLFPYTTLFRSAGTDADFHLQRARVCLALAEAGAFAAAKALLAGDDAGTDRE